nr:hypothetical protein [Tanacetum cinerariifolium]
IVIDSPKCGNPVYGLYCRHCALLRKKLKEVWFTVCDEQNFFQDFLNTFESSNDNSNVVNAPQDPIVFNQDPDENSSQSPPHIDHQCCYGCGDSLDGIFCQRCTCKSCGKGAHYGYNCPSKVLIISNPEPCHDQNVDDFDKFQPSQPVTDHLNLQQRINDSMIELCGTFQAWLEQRKAQVVNLDFYSPKPLQYRKIPICYDDDDDAESSTSLRDIIIFKLPSCIAITPILSTKETKDSLIMGDEHLDTIPEKESDEFIKSSVENLVPSLSKSEDERKCDVPVCDDFTTFSNLLFDADNDFSTTSYF